MARRIEARGAQWLLCMEFEFNFDDTVVGTDGIEKSFGAVAGDSPNFALGTLPAGGMITSGALYVESAFAGPTTATLTLDGGGLAAPLFPAVNVKTAGRTAVTIPTQVVDGTPLVAHLNCVGGAATAGKVWLVLNFVQRGKVDHVTA